MFIVTRAAQRIQNNFRKRAYRFSKQRLIERLELEMNLGDMGSRFWLFALLFIMISMVIQHPRSYNLNLLTRSYVESLWPLTSLDEYSQSDMTDVLTTFVAKAYIISPSTGQQRAIYALSPPLLVWETFDNACDSIVQSTLLPNNCPAYCTMGCTPTVGTSTLSMTYTNVVVEGVSGRGYVLKTGNIPELGVNQINSATVYQPFYSPASAGTGTDEQAGVLIIKWDTDFLPSWKLVMYESVHTDTLSSWKTILVFAFIIVLMELFVELSVFKRELTYSSSSWYKILTSMHFFKFLIELSSMGVMLAFLSYSNLVWTDSYTDFLEDMKSMANITWATGAADGFAILDDILTTMAYQEIALLLGVTCLYILTFRLAQSMSMHPRIALFVDTFVMAAQEVLHFMWTFAVLFLVMGVIGWLSNTKLYSSYRTYGVTLWTQWALLMYSQITEVGWNQDWKSATYFIVFTILVLFVLLTFFTAIIIDTYMKIRLKVEKQITEQSMLQDCIDCSRAIPVWFKRGVPSRAALINRLKRMKAVKTVTMETLMNMGLYQNFDLCLDFCRFYHQFDFLKPDDFLNQDESRDRDDEKWNRVLLKVEDHLINTELDHEVVKQYENDIDDRLQAMESRVGSILSEVRGKDDTDDEVKDATQLSDRKFVRTKRNIFDELRVKRVVQKEIKNIIRQKKLKDNIADAHNEAVSAINIPNRGIIKRNSDPSPETNKRRTINPTENTSPNGDLRFRTLPRPSISKPENN